MSLVPHVSMSLFGGTYLGFFHLFTSVHFDFSAFFLHSGERWCASRASDVSDEVAYGAAELVMEEAERVDGEGDTNQIGRAHV